MRFLLPDVTPYLRIGGREWSMPTALRALRHRNFRLYSVGQLVSLTGSWMQSTAQQWLVFRMTGSPLALGVVAALSAVPITLLTIPAGIVIDRVDKRRLLVGLELALMALALTLATLVFLDAVTFWHVCVLAMLQGVVVAFELPTRNAFAIEMVGREDLMNAIALNSSTFNGARLLGPALAGILVATLGEGPAFLANGLSFLAVILALVAMRLPKHSRPKRNLRPVEEIREGLSFMAKSRTILPLVVIATIPSIIGFPFTTQLPVIAVDRLGLEAGGFGLLTSALGVGALIAAASLASLGDVRRKGLLLTVARLAFAGALTIIALSRSVPLSALAMGLAGWGMITQLATTNTLLQLEATDALRGRVMAAWTWCIVGTAPIGAALIGAIAERFSASSAVLAAGLACAISALASLVLWPQLRKI